MQEGGADEDRSYRYVQQHRAHKAASDFLLEGCGMSVAGHEQRTFISGREAG